jgi:hypothetical protein
MIKVLVTVNAVVFIAIAVIHFYWALGGTWAAKAVLPVKADGQLTFKPGFIATFFVGLVFIVLTFITLGNLDLFKNYISLKYFACATAFIAAIFFIRFVGDFKFVGITKKIKNTVFANNDTKYYTPLCLMLAIINLIIAGAFLF